MFLWTYTPKTGSQGMLGYPERKEIEDEEEAVFGAADHRDFAGD